VGEGILHRQAEGDFNRQTLKTKMIPRIACLPCFQVCFAVSVRLSVCAFAVSLTSFYSYCNKPAPCTLVQSPPQLFRSRSLTFALFFLSRQVRGMAKGRGNKAAKSKSPVPDRSRTHLLAAPTLTLLPAPTFLVHTHAHSSAHTHRVSMYHTV